MAELIGLLLLGATFALLGLLGPWFRRHQDSILLERWMAAEMLAVFLAGLGATGACLVIAVLVTSWQSGDARQIALSHGAAIVGVSALALGSRWLGRIVERRKGARPAAAKHLVPAE